MSYSIIDRKAGGGIVITASHNPWQWNGFKYKPEYGGSASPEVVAELEEPSARDSSAARSRRVDIDDAKKQGLVEMFDPRPALPRAARPARRPRPPARRPACNVCVDAMYGTGAGYFDDLIGGGKTKVTE